MLHFPDRGVGQCGFHLRGLAALHLLCAWADTQTSRPPCSTFGPRKVAVSEPPGIKRGDCVGAKDQGRTLPLKPLAPNQEKLHLP